MPDNSNAVAMFDVSQLDQSDSDSSQQPTDNLSSADNLSQGDTSISQFNSISSSAGGGGMESTLVDTVAANPELLLLV